jgi:hypothetical protein
MGKKSGERVRGSGMYILNLIFENPVSVFGLKILKFFNADPGSGMEKIDLVGYRYHPGSATPLDSYGTGTLQKVDTYGTWLPCL